MRKIYFVLALLAGNFLIQAQTSPQVNFSFSSGTTANVVNFTNTSQALGDGAKKAFWNFGDGSPSAVTGAYDGAAHYYNVAGTYQVCLKIYRYPVNTHDSVLIGSVCKSVTIQQNCTADYQWYDSVSTNPLVHHVKLFGLGQTNSNRVIKEVCWNFGDGTDTCIIATAGSAPPLNITHKYINGGNYNVCIRIKYDGGCVAEKCKTVVIPPTTVPDSCASNFTVQPVSATALGRRFVAQPWHNKQKKVVKICWDFGDGKDTCIQYSASFTGDYVAEHKYAQYGQYVVCATIKYDGGCEKKTCHTVSINPVTPPADTCIANISEVATNISNLERRFYTSLHPNKTAQKICWNFGDGSDTCIILTSPINPQQLMVMHKYAAPGNYRVCVRVVYAGGCVAEFCRMTEIKIPQNTLCGGYISDSAVSANTVKFKGTGIQNANDYVLSYSWTFGDGTSGIGQQVTHIYQRPGNYSVCLLMKTALGCETKICKKVVVAGHVQPQVVLSPNPVLNTLTAVFQSLLQQSMSVRIYNGNGIMVRSYSRNAVVGTNTWTFDVASLPTGVYSVVVQSPTQFATAIFFKQ